MDDGCDYFIAVAVLEPSKEERLWQVARNTGSLLIQRTLGMP